MAGFLDQIEDPDIILLHIGVNDFGPKGHDREHAINRLSKLLTKISKLQPHSHIMTTNLMYRHGYWTEIQRFFNVFVEDLVHEHVRNGENIQYVDLQTIQYPADFQDRVHPNAVGFQKMGEAWADVIMNTIGPYSELCLDENKPRFIDVDLDDKQKGCKWLRNRKDKATIDNICSSNDDAKQHCKVTCGTCPISIGPTSTIHPSLTSSILPTTTKIPSFAPTNSPTKTQLPTVGKTTFPTITASINPTSTIHPSLTSSILPTTTKIPSFAP